jgi:hypothetical protein
MVLRTDAIGLIAISTFPPYSIPQFVAMRDASSATLKIVYDFTAYAGRRRRNSNASLHDFRDAKEITHDLANHGDVVHHSPAVALKIRSMMTEEKYVVVRAARRHR